MLIGFILVLFLFLLDRISAINVLINPILSRGSLPQFSNINFPENWTRQCDVPCVWTDHPSDTDAVFYLLSNNFDALWAFRDKKRAPISIGGSIEGQHYHSFLSNEYIHKYLGTSAMLATGSHIPWRVGYGDYPLIHKAAVNQHQLRIAVSTNSNCVSKNNGDRIVMEIDQIMPVNRIGKCLNNEPWPICGDKPCTKLEAIKHYMFCLAFENGNTAGYVTEKIFDCHRAGSIPVYLGTAEVAGMVPRGSFIFVGDFKTSFHLARYLLLVATDVILYESYFAWKNVPLDSEFVERNKAYWEYNIQCRVCRYVSVVQQGLTWDIGTQNGTNETQPSKPELTLNRVPQVSSNNQRLKIRSFVNTKESNSTNQLIGYSLLLVTLFIILIALRFTKKLKIFSHFRLLWIK